MTLYIAQEHIRVSNIIDKWAKWSTFNFITDDWKFTKTFNCINTDLHFAKPLLINHTKSPTVCTYDTHVMYPVFVITTSAPHLCVRMHQRILLKRYGWPNTAQE